MVVFLAADLGSGLLIGAVVVAALFALLVVAALVNYGAIWFEAYMAGADVSLMSLIGMSFRQVKSRLIVTAKIMGRQAGLNINRQQGMSTARLEAHFLAGGDVMHVLRAIIAAHRAGIDLDFERAAAIDLAGRDVVDAVRRSNLDVGARTLEINRAEYLIRGLGFSCPAEGELPDEADPNPPKPTCPLVCPELAQEASQKAVDCRNKVARQALVTSTKLPSPIHVAVKTL